MVETKGRKTNYRWITNLAQKYEGLSETEREEGEKAIELPLRAARSR